MIVGFVKVKVFLRRNVTYLSKAYSIIKCVEKTKYNCDNNYLSVIIEV